MIEEIKSADMALVIKDIVSAMEQANRKMKSAYMALTMKDMVSAIERAIRWPSVVVAMIGAVLSMGPGAVAGIALAMCVLCIEIEGIALALMGLCRCRIRSLGFTEVDLERMNLA